MKSFGGPRSDAVAVGDRNGSREVNFKILRRSPTRLAFRRLLEPKLAHIRRTRPQPAPVAPNKTTGFRPGRSGACEARLFRFIGQAHGEMRVKTEWVTVYVAREFADADLTER